MIFISPTEPAELRAIGRTKLFPENFGADVAIRPHANLGDGFIGIQRKEVSDLIASMADGRLAQQVMQLAGGCLMGVLVIEGRFRWTLDGELMDGWGSTVTKGAIESLLWTIQYAGVHVCYTDGLKDTVDWCLRFEKWAQKTDHGGLSKRPGPMGDAWGRVGNRDWARHLLMGFKGIGPKVADAIVERFEGVPMQWTVGVGEMMTVPGVGKGRAEGLMKALEHGVTGVTEMETEV